MDELVSGLKTFLFDAAEELRKAHLPAALPEAMERLSAQIDQPCVVAVVGRMKSGKSTFINALLGQDLAKVGVTETTATINYFRYGPTDPAKPVRCHWQNGSLTEEDRSFLDGLQGNDVETLRRASGIKHLEYHLLEPYLERVVLVDTPGTSAVVDDHVQRTAEFLALQRHVRDRHDAATRRLGSEADAVVYLVGQVARATDQAFLQEFAEVTGGRSRALNAVGVLAKVDLHPEILRRRHELASKIGEQLKDSLNTVVPVSAGIQRAVDRLRERGNSSIVDFLATLQRIPVRRLEKLLGSEEFYRELETDDCPVTVSERDRLLDGMPWAVFTTLVRTAVSSAFAPVATEVAWQSLSGFDRLRELLDQHFIRRAQFLRSSRVVHDARSLLNEVRFKHLPERRACGRDQRQKLDRFLQFVRAARGDRSVARELEDFLVHESGLTADTDTLDRTWKGLDLRLSEFDHDLEAWDADFQALRSLEEHAPDFTAAELAELRRLFGQYGSDPTCRVDQLDVGIVARRQQGWIAIMRREMSLPRRMIAERAVARYGMILSQLAAGSSLP
jgi:hypothetical protein